MLISRSMCVRRAFLSRELAGSSVQLTLLKCLEKSTPQNDALTLPPWECLKARLASRASGGVVGLPAGWANAVCKSLQ